MALKKGNTAGNSDKAQFEKAVAFVNFSLPTRDGKTIRLIALPLVESNDTHKQLHTYLTVDEKGVALTPEVAAERLENLKSRIVLDVGFPRSADDSQLSL